MSMTDHRGHALHVGDRVITISWGGDVPLWLSSAQATIVGFARTRVRVRFDGEAYGGKWPEFRAVHPRHLRRLPVCEVCGDPLDRPTGAGWRAECASAHQPEGAVK